MIVECVLVYEKWAMQGAVSATVLVTVASRIRVLEQTCFRQPAGFVEVRARKNFADRASIPSLPRTLVQMPCVCGNYRARHFAGSMCSIYSKCLPRVAVHCG